MNKFSKLESIDLRRVWKNETSDFNTWLFQEENLEILSDELGLELSPFRKEFKYKNVRVDILAIDNDDQSYVLIENQLAASDYAHMGKILDYIKHFNPKITIWIVKEYTDFHEHTLKILQDQSEFFIVKLEVFKIDDSRLAPKFTIISEPKAAKRKRTKNKKDRVIFDNNNKNITNNSLSKSYIPKKSLSLFLKNSIVPGEKYAKQNLLNKYVEFSPDDAETYMKKHSQAFSRALTNWAKSEGFLVNQGINNLKSRGMYKSNGIEYFVFTERKSN